MRRKVVIVIPIHKSTPTKNEMASFAQCYKVLGNHPIRIVAPKGLDVSTYTDLVSDAQFVFIDPHWLSSIEQYNKLKISLYFYNLFKDYEYLLTYELDAWVFRDELLYWCDKGYDYIGAPWFEGWHMPASNQISGVGNSGFSLRKVHSCSRILARISRLKKIRRVWYKTKLQGLYRFETLFQKIRKIFYVKDIDGALSLIYDSWHEHEDFNWCQIIPNYFEDFRLAPVDDASKFSFDANPEYLFNLNHDSLPFGCHAWERFSPEFWKSFINKVYVKMK